MVNDRGWLVAIRTATALLAVGIGPAEARTAGTAVSTPPGAAAPSGAVAPDKTLNLPDAARAPRAVVDLGAIGADSPFLTTYRAVCPVSNGGTCNPSGAWANILLNGITTRDSTQGENTLMVGGLVTTGDPNGQKATVYIGTMQSGPRAGTAWSLNTDTVRNGNPSGINGQAGSGTPGAADTIGTSDGTIGYELDYTNWDRDCTTTRTFCVGMYVHNQGLYASGAGIYFDSHPQNGGQNNYAWHHGIWFNNAYTLQDDAFYDATDATSSVRIEGHHTSAIYDNSTSQTAFAINGSHSGRDILTVDSSPSVLEIQGTHVNGIDGTNSTATITNLINGRAGQAWCLNSGDDCLLYDAVVGAWAWKAGGTEVAILTPAGLFNPTGGITTSGPVVETGGASVTGGFATDTLTVTGALQTRGGVVTTRSAAYTFAASDCGTVIRDTGRAAHTDTIPAGLPVGCRLSIEQAGPGAVTIAAASGVTAEYSSGSKSNATSANRYASVKAFIDTGTTAVIGTTIP